MTALIRYDAMCKAIADARKIDEVKDIIDKATAFEVYSKQAKNFDNERWAAEIRVRAERKAGELLKAMPKTQGARGLGSNQYKKKVGSNDPTPPKTLEQLGISKDQSSRFQQLADVPNDEFEGEVTKPGKPPKATSILKKFKKKRGSKAKAKEPEEMGKKRNITFYSFTDDEWEKVRSLVEKRYSTNLSALVEDFVRTKLDEPTPTTSRQRFWESSNPKPLTERVLSREEVDPDFKGDGVAFAREYGALPTMTKQQRDFKNAFERADAMLIAMQNFVAKAPGTITNADMEAWLEDGRKAEQKAGERAKGRSERQFAERVNAFVAVARQILALTVVREKQSVDA